MKTNGLAVVSLSLLAACADAPQDGATSVGDSSIDLGGETEGEAESGSESGSGEGESGSESGGDEFPGEGGSGGGDESSVPHCGGDTIQVTAVPPNVMLVLDKSGSMTQPENDWDHDGDSNTPDQSRWMSLHDVVADLLGTYDDSMNFGAVLFPAIDADTNGSACEMADEAEVPVAAHNMDAVLAAIPERDAETGGGTPARFGVLNAVDHLAGLDVEGARAIVLVTDGEANCVPGVDPFHSEYDAELELAVGSAFTDNAIPTYVVGIDIDDDDLSGDDDRTLRQAMNDIARAGGVSDTFYDVTDHSALEAALDEIAARVSCTIELPQTPEHPDYLEIEVDGQLVDHVETCDGGAGWRYVDEVEPFDTIELCGSACDTFVTVGAMETAYQCPPEG